MNRAEHAHTYNRGGRVSIMENSQEIKGTPLPTCIIAEVIYNGFKVDSWPM